MLGNHIKSVRVCFIRPVNFSMRKIIVSIITGLSLLALLSGGSARGAFAGGKNVRVLTSFYPMYIMALNVARDVPGVSVESLAPPVTGCLHDYALTAEEMKRIADADILIANGAGMESFIDRVTANYPRLKVARLSEGIDLIRDGDNINPHVWVGISGAIAEVKNLGKAMQEFDPAHSDLYRKNTKEYVDRLETLREKMRSELVPYKGRKIITFHEAFPYFAKEFDLIVAAVIEREPGVSPGARDLARTIDLIKRSGIKALFGEGQYPLAAAETIAKEAGIKIFLLDPAVAGPDDAAAYIVAMEKNLEVLKEAFETERPG